MINQQALVSLQNIDLDDVKQGRKTGIEENVKQKIVIPLLQLLNYTIEKDMDFEHHVENRRADIALLVKRQPKIIVECKSLEKDLDNFINQAIEYAENKAIPYVILTNGDEFRLYRTFIENVVNPRDRELLRVIRKNITIDFKELYGWVSRDSILGQTLDKKCEEKAKLIGESVTAPTLIQNLKDAKKILKDEAKEKIPSLIRENLDFKNNLDEWAKSNEFDLNNSDSLLDHLANEIAYSFITRLYFYRIAEDNGIVKAKLSRGELTNVLNYLTPNQLLDVCWREIWKIDYHAIFRKTFFDMVQFDEETIKKILYRLTNYNFAKINYDILGKVYQEHISREERKELGQYYTPDWIAKFILENIPISINDKVMDPACGSGTFLVHAYDALKERYLLEDYDKNSIHNLILQKNIFGKDLNPLAVQLTATNLAMKNLGKKTDDINIIACDSLTKDLSHYFEMLRMDLNNEGKTIIADHIFPKKYNVIVGNPPYFVIRRDEIKKKYPSMDYSDVTKSRTNIASLFLKKYIDDLEEDGHLGFVIPKSITYVEPWSDIREYILKNCQIIAIYDLKEAFESVLLEQVAIVLRKTKSIHKDAEVEVLHKERKGDKNIEIRYTIPHKQFTKERFPLYMTPESRNLWKKLNHESLPLGDIARITRGLGIQKLRNQFTEKRCSANDIPIVGGKDIGKFFYRGMNYLDASKKQFDIYRDKINSLLVKKVVAQNIVAQTGNHIKIIANFDDGKIINLDTVTNIIPKKEEFSPKYLIAIINSKLASFFLYNFVYNRSVRTMHLEYIKHLPIKIPDKRKKEVENLVDELLKLYSELDVIKRSIDVSHKFMPKSLDNQRSEKTIQKQIAILQVKIDRKVYDLYDLSEREIEEIKNQI